MTRQIDSVRVNGSVYRISSGSMPLVAYEASNLCDQPSFTWYQEGDDDAFSKNQTMNFWVRRTGSNGNYDYDLIVTVSGNAHTFDDSRNSDDTLNGKKPVNSVNVNGATYGLSFGGTLPISVYRGTIICGMPYFYGYTPTADERFYRVDPLPFMRKTQVEVGSCSFDFDIVLLVNESGAIKDIPEYDWVEECPY